MGSFAVGVEVTADGKRAFVNCTYSDRLHISNVYFDNLQKHASLLIVQQNEKFHSKVKNAAFCFHWQRYHNNSECRSMLINYFSKEDNHV